MPNIVDEESSEENDESQRHSAPYIETFFRKHLFLPYMLAKSFFTPLRMLADPSEVNRLIFETFNPRLIVPP